MNRTFALALAALALGCNRPATPVATSPDASPAAPPAEAGDGAVAAAPSPAPVAPELLPDGGAPSPAPATAPPSPPAPAPLASALARTGTQELPLQREGVTVLDPGSAFELEVAVHLSDGRLSLHDEADAMVAATGTTELGEGSSHYRLVPDEPLRPGSRYALHLDGAVTRELHGPEGRTFAPVVLQLKTSGERPAAPQKKKRGSRR